ncbi:predicted protein [Sclerotinia sclerotiorum 1980 UF-70]|uniref:Uncharacterized protein n=1 Tax=Sclerotinia sclerotiorum (strain ATCC 18683 / 1980 / Ss-1) TaxID=665079 RepID=A7F031_SCLS1|nr:predicted protein [Sclerotinia sclerotiorum 1980 UF-70]EDN95073.1 predicted protein [Sclerotinia sclerotiorum 1980 UF-70]
MISTPRSQSTNSSKQDTTSNYQVELVSRTKSSHWVSQISSNRIRRAGRAGKGKKGKKG